MLRNQRTWRAAGRRGCRVPAVMPATMLLVLALVAGACSSDGSGSEGVEAAGEDGTPPPTTADSTEPAAESVSDPEPNPEDVSDPADGPADDAGPSEDVVAADPVASAGCGVASTSDPVVEAERTLTVDGVDRRYLITVPSAHDAVAPLPVVFDFHGLLEGAEVHAGMSAYSEVAEDEGFVVVFPHGSGEPLSWNINPALDPNPDVVYFDAVLAQVQADLCVDLSRVYATGLSNGAMFTSVLVCQRADVVAAAAPVAGITDVADCDPARPVPLVSFHGTADPILLFNGGVDLSMIPGTDGPVTDGSTPTSPPADLDGAGYPANVATFAARNGCAPDPVDAELTAEVIHRVYDCPDGADVEFYIVVGGGHSWPGSTFSESIGDIVGPTSFDIDASRDAWAFLQRFSLG